HRAAVAVRAAFLLSVELGHQLVGVRALGERVAVGSMRGCDHVAVLERPADADGAGFLPDRDMEKARQLARTEALLDLLLEATDQEHLPQDVPQFGLREARSLRHLCHGGQCTVRAVKLVEQWDRLQEGLDPSWDGAVLSLRIVDDKARSRAAALLAPAGPGLAGKGLRFQVSRRGGGIGPEALRPMV